MIGIGIAIHRGVFSNVDPLYQIPVSYFIVSFAFFAVNKIVDIFRKPELTLKEIIRGYIGLMIILWLIFTLIFWTIDYKEWGSIRFNCDSKNAQVSESFWYYSATTLIGSNFNDLCPFGTWMKTVSVIEDFFGNFITVIVIAIAINKLVTQRRRR